MGKYAGLIAGAIATVAGIILLVGWWGYFTALLKGAIPAMLVFAGAVAVIAALSEMKDEADSKKEGGK